MIYDLFHMSVGSAAVVVATEFLLYCVVARR
jgi:hypothetical protein